MLPLNPSPQSLCVVLGRPPPPPIKEPHTLTHVWLTTATVAGDACRRLALAAALVYLAGPAAVYVAPQTAAGPAEQRCP